VNDIDISDNNDDVISISNYSNHKDASNSFPIDKSIPGHTDYKPYNLNDKTRLQYASTIVSAAIVFMTLKVRFDKWIYKWNKEEINNITNKEVDLIDNNNIRKDNEFNINNNNIVKLSNGIIYEGIIDDDNNTFTPSSSSSSSSIVHILQYGNHYRLLIKVYYNGYLVKNYNNIPFIYGISNNIFNQLSLHGLNENGIFDNMKNYKNLKRIIILPSIYAYGDKGEKPYIPANASIKVELSVM